MQNVNYKLNALEVKETITRQCLWQDIYSEFPEIAAAVANPNKHITCIFHGGEGDFRFQKDAFTSHPKYPSAVAICTCGTFSHYEVFCHLSGFDVTDIRAIQRLAEYAGIGESPVPGSATPVKPPVQQAKDNQPPPRKSTAPTQSFKNLLTRAQEGAHGAVAQYLRNRGLGDAVGKFPWQIRSLHSETYYHPDDHDDKKFHKIPDVPVMLAMIQDLSGKILGTQRIYLNSDGTKLKPYWDQKADSLTLTPPEPENPDDLPVSPLPCKKVMKTCEDENVARGAVHLGEPVESLSYAEGVESSLAVAIGLEDLEDNAVWSTVSAAYMPSTDSPPDRVKTVFIFADKDKSKAGQIAAEKLADRLVTECPERDVYILLPKRDIPEGKTSIDWLDILELDGKQAIINAATNLPVPYQSKAKEPDSNVVPFKGGSTAANEITRDKEEYSFRSPPSFEIPRVRVLTMDQTIEILNRHFVHVVQGGKNYCVRTGRNGQDKKYLEYFSRPQFLDLFSHWPKTVIGYDTKKEKEITQNTGLAWLSSPDANICYDGVTFYPSDVDYHNGRVNPYYGFGVDPVECSEDDIRLWLDHLKEVICGNVDEHYEYALNWFAHLIQKPEDKIGTALVLRGRQGTGKNTAIIPIGQIMGSHYLYAGSPRIVIEKFNALMENKIFVFADEAIFHLRSASDQMKTLVSEVDAVVERKKVDAFTTDSFSRIVMSTDHEHPINVGVDERRYLFLEVSEEKMQDTEYFKPFREKINSGYLAPRLLHFLLNRDISEFAPHDVPKTDALRDQKLDFLDPYNAYIFDFLTDGCIPKNGGWAARKPYSDIQNDFREWAEARKIKLEGHINMRLGKKLAKVNILRVGEINGNTDNRMYEFPELGEVRKAFEKAIHHDINW